MKKNIIVAFILVISNLNAIENTIDNISTSNKTLQNNIQLISNNIKQVNLLNYDVFNLNGAIQDFVKNQINILKNNQNNNTIIYLNNLSNNSIIFSLSIYKNNSHMILSSIDEIKNTLSNLLMQSNLDQTELKQIENKFSRICKILFANRIENKCICKN